jgi:NTP pyrophosphatase (non-canonical NTP hydrolase)
MAPEGFSDENGIENVSQDEIVDALTKTVADHSVSYTFKDYQKIADMTSGRNTMSHVSWMNYLVCGLFEEVGEVARHVAHATRDEGFRFPKDLSRATVETRDLNGERKERLAKELGDVLWFISQLAREIGTDLEGAALGNNVKLLNRLAHGKINGEGDDR